MKLVRLPSETSVAAAAANLFAQVVEARPDANVVVPAGRTPILMLEDIVRKVRAGGLDVKRARFFQLDEYVGVPPSNPRSFHAFLQLHLLRPLGTEIATCAALLDGMNEHPARHVEDHARRLAAQGGAHLVLLGLGLNGHLGFNEPGSSKTSAARLVDLHAATLQTTAQEFDRKELPRQGITLGLRELLAATQIGVLVTGASKAAILRDLFEKPQSPDRPASFLRDHPHCSIFADSGACSLLAPGVCAAVE